MKAPGRSGNQEGQCASVSLSVKGGVSVSVTGAVWAPGGRTQFPDLQHHVGKLVSDLVRLQLCLVGQHFPFLRFSCDKTQTSNMGWQ